MAARVWLPEAGLLSDPVTLNPGEEEAATLSPAEVCAVIAAAHADHRMAIVHTQAEWAARQLKTARPAWWVAASRLDG